MVVPATHSSVAVWCVEAPSTACAAGSLRRAESDERVDRGVIAGIALGCPLNGRCPAVPTVGRTGWTDTT